MRGGTREYFQNKILEIFLSPVGFYKRDEDSCALGHGCINEIRESRYIVYGDDREIGRRRFAVDRHVAVALECADEPKLGQTLPASSPAGLPVNELVFHYVARGEAARDLPKNCHPLPSTAIFEPQNR